MEEKEPEKEIDGVKTSALRELLESVVIAVVLAIVIRMFVIEPFYIPSGSMEPTLMVNDRIIVSKLSYHFEQPEYGDIVVFKYPMDTSRNFVKRLIGEPGDTVELKDSKLYINGEAMPESFLPAGLQYDNFGPIEVPAGQYFMLGDNRNNSEDSRYWGFLPEDLIVGKAVFIYWPLDRLSIAR
ncbi:signal peptidase I [Peptococcaceae bacterium 1198_IL3148]